MIPIDNFLVLSAILFSLGMYGVLARRNAVLILMSVELMLQAVVINFVAFAVYLDPETFTGLILTRLMHMRFPKVAVSAGYEKFGDEYLAMMPALEARSIRKFRSWCRVMCARFISMIMLPRSCMKVKRSDRTLFRNSQLLTPIWLHQRKMAVRTRGRRTVDTSLKRLRSSLAVIRFS